MVEKEDNVERPDGRKFDEPREMEAKVGIIDNAFGSAMFRFGDTVALAGVYGPKVLHPQHLQNPKKALLRCYYNMISFSVPDRSRPGPGRRDHEIGKVTEWALSDTIDLEQFPSQVVDIHISILQANASTRCAGINAASLALANAGLPMKEMVSSVSIGKLDKGLVVDLTKEEEDFEEGEGATDLPLAFTPSGKITLMQMDGQISSEQLKEGIKLGKKACEKVYEVQKEALKNMGDK